jgi:hypothetical protein
MNTTQDKIIADIINLSFRRVLTPEVLALRQKLIDFNKLTEYEIDCWITKIFKLGEIPRQQDHTVLEYLD